MQELIKIKADENELEGMLDIPDKPKGIVLFAHGSGSGRFSPRNNFVAQVLHQGNHATLLIDLLTSQEDKIYENRFNIPLLTKRLILAIHWLKKNPSSKSLPLGIFGASTGAAAALEAAAALGDEIKAVVSRGGRPDLAANVLDKVTSPSLFIVGGDDFGVIELNQGAFTLLNCTKKFEIIPGATHLFEEPGALEQVASLANKWFTKFL